MEDSQLYICYYYIHTITTILSLYFTHSSKELVRYATYLLTIVEIQYNNFTCFVLCFYFNFSQYGAVNGCDCEHDLLDDDDDDDDDDDLDDGQNVLEDEYYSLDYYHYL